MTADSSHSNTEVGRIAPSPTGRMHIGNVYAALAAWLDSRTLGGSVRLRIEDIDTFRVVADADRWIMDDLNWLGLDWDGDAVYQSARVDLYDEVFRSLGRQVLSSGDPLIYPCFCSRADIRAASAPNEGDGFLLYPGTCRSIDGEHRERRLTAGDRHSWRIAVPGSDGDADDSVVFDDEVFGSQRFSLSRELGDVIVRRSDGVFAYQFATAVDDWLMGVTRIVRGRDLLRSTAIQLWIRRHCAGHQQMDRLSSESHAQEPVFAHLPLIDDTDGRRMAKRFGSVDMGELREAGRSPEEVIGICAWLLGLLKQPQPLGARDLLRSFSFDHLRGNRQDRSLESLL